MSIEAEGRAWINRKINGSEHGIWCISVKEVETLLKKEGRPDQFIKAATEELKDRKRSA